MEHALKDTWAHAFKLVAKVQGMDGIDFAAIHSILLATVAISLASLLCPLVQS